MTQTRVLSPFETGYFTENTRLGSVPIGGMPLFVGTTVRGEVDVAVLRRVLGELAAGHVLLRSRLGPDATRFEVDAGYRPPLRVLDGELDEYWRLVNSRPDWSNGLLRAVLLRGREQTRLVLIVHHGISDGRSGFALLEELWQRYRAHLAGTPLPLLDSDRDLIDGVDTLLAAVTSDAEVDGFLDQVRAMAGQPGDAPHTLPLDGDGIGDPNGRLALRRIELDARHTAELVTVARAHRISVNSLLTGAALSAVRGEVPASGPVPLMCGHAVDLRPELTPRVPVSTVLNCASGAGTAAVVDHDSDPLALAVQADAMLRQLLDGRFPALFMRASQRPLEASIAAVLDAAPAIALSNMGRLPAHSMPATLQFVRDEVFAMAAGMPPKMTIFTVGERLTIQVEYDTAEHSHAQMGRVAEAMSAQLTRLARTASARA